VNRELVEALLGSLNKKERECDKAYELIGSKASPRYGFLIQVPHGN
jgi:hypothetical protein